MPLPPYIHQVRRVNAGFAFVYFEDEQDKILSITSIIGHLDMTGAGYLWNGLRYDSERGDRCRDSPLEGAVMVDIVIVLIGNHQVLVIAGVQVLITVFFAAQFMTGTTVQCMTGAGVLDMEGMRVMNTADTAVARLSKDEELEVI